MPSITHPDLPDQLALLPHHTVLPRGALARQLGLHPEHGVGVDGLSPPLAHLLDELAAPVGTAGLVERAVARGADRGEARALLRELLEAGALVDAGPARLALRRRAGSTVVVEGAGPLAVGVVLGLLAGGAGTVHAITPGEVGPADLGTGLADADLGSGRARALSDAAERLRPGSAVTGPPSRLQPDLVVLTDVQVVPPQRRSELHLTGTPHLQVRMRDGIGVAGPLVLPGRSACLSCLDRHRAEHDPGWPGMALLLAERTGRGDPACAAATAALGTAQALLALDGAGTTPSTCEATLEIDVRTGVSARREWTPHPSCPCGAPRRGRGHPGAECVPTATRGTLGT